MGRLDLDAVARVLGAKDTRFTALVKLSGIDPATDLRGCNLSNIVIGPDECVAGYDFSDAVLDGATLRGLDLRRAIVTKCSFASTNLEGARMRPDQVRSLRLTRKQKGSLFVIGATARKPVAPAKKWTLSADSTIPTNWAMTQNNLGNALATQGEGVGGDAGLALLAEAVAAYRAALTVYTESTMPTDWATTQENVALAFDSMAALRDDPLPDLRAAETAVLAALRVYTSEHMSFYHAKATRLLARIRAKIAERGG